MQVPTVDDLLSQTATGCGLHQWRTEGGAIQLTTEELASALTAAYDPSMPDWPSTLTWDDDTNSFFIP